MARRKKQQKVSRHWFEINSGRVPMLMEFYLDEVYRQATYAERSQVELQNALANSDGDEAFRRLTAMAAHMAHVSWLVDPTGGDPKRGQFLRAVLSLRKHELKALSNRSIRDVLTHFDEQMDIFSAASSNEGTTNTTKIPDSFGDLVAPSFFGVPEGMGRQIAICSKTGRLFFFGMEFETNEMIKLIGTIRGRSLDAIKGKLIYKLWHEYNNDLSTIMKDLKSSKIYSIIYKLKYDCDF